MKKGMFLTLLWCGVAVADMSRSGEIVTDSKTKLMWQDNADASTVTRNWQGAIDYCESLNFGGYNDWRLPNIRELQSITYRSRYPAINSTFTNLSGSEYRHYWSSTSEFNLQDNGWFIGFNYAGVNKEDKNNIKSLRCVRAGR